MRSTIEDLPVTTDLPLARVRQVDWGSMTVGVAEIHQDVDISPLLKGLPDDRCQCPHWGYVLKGTMRFQIGDNEEVFSAGDVYYIAPGHTGIVEAGTQYIEFSPKDELIKSTEVINRNMEALS